MKRIISLFLSLICCSCLFSGCNSSYCDPKDKEWYNAALLPDIRNPFNEVYDGKYSIQIDKDGNVTFKTLKGETFNGYITKSFKNKTLRSTNISIQFDNGKTATARCSKTDTGRQLTITNDFKDYYFSDKKCVSKQEFETYRSQFIDFLTNVYNTGVYPALTEVAHNNLYIQFTNYVQIDPCCGGPFIYDSAQKANLQNVESTENKYYYSVDCRVGSDSEALNKKISVEEDFENIVLVKKQGTLEKLNEIREGDCLILWESNDTIDMIYYFE